MSKVPTLPPLPKIMVAPNGARRTKADHPALPVTISEVVEAAQACQKAGADGLHAHVRDINARHILDKGLYLELLAELKQTVSDLYVQITTEAVGIYSPSEQRQLVRDVRPKAVSISVKEMLSEGENAEIGFFYQEQAEAGTAIQHILYGADDVALLQDLCNRSIVPQDQLQLLFVLGRYTEGQVSHPDDIQAFMTALAALEQSLDVKTDWAVCAFGQAETSCLSKAIELGGKVRIGFENNLHNADGSLALDNADRVRDLLAATQQAA